MPQPKQDESALQKNRDFFADNDGYKRIQGELEHYRFIALSAAEAVQGARRLLDIGNGGIFVFPIDQIEEVVAIDVFVEEGFSQRYPKVRWLQMSALDMSFHEEFDTVTEVNTLHHIIGSTVRETYRNLDRFFQGAYAALSPNGRLILLESTVPVWFLAPYKVAFAAFVKIWPLKHPPTFQFHYRDLLHCAESKGFELREFCWIPKTSDILAFGRRVKPWMTPIRTAKMIFVKRPYASR